MDESYLITAIKLLHSSAPDSAEKMRSMLNTEILKHYDKTKLVENHLSKKQIDSLITQENKAVGSGFKRKHKSKKIEEAKLATAPVISENQIIKTRDDDLESSSDNSSAAMDLLTDLTCVVCRQMDNSANNQLFECIECHQLWHQLCHTTKIPSETNQNTWICSSCNKNKKKEVPAKPSKTYESSSSSSSSHHKEKKREKEEKEEKPAEKKKSEGSSSSSSKSQKKPKESSSSSSSSRSRSSKKSS